ncbi:hypothetical protein VNO77_44858 [Canavalia gladiata]|uniref:Uncharacterized protein n=1 Tax=Canavalia gladiata TaxID=3824 RepID=A0AAN9JYZ3_CANGL
MPDCPFLCSLGLYEHYIKEFNKNGLILLMVTILYKNTRVVQKIDWALVPMFSTQGFMVDLGILIHIMTFLCCAALGGQ